MAIKKASISQRWLLFLLPKAILAQYLYNSPKIPVMNKYPILFVLGIMVLLSCSRKTVPAKYPAPKNVLQKTDIDTKPEPVTHTPLVVKPENPVTIPAPPKPDVLPGPMIVIDEKGEIITDKASLPDDIAANVDFRKIARSYTPSQRQNLIYRFKMVPPRVFYIPDRLASQTARGSYIIYKKKFWYWKKEDGLFHLDETYYE